RALGGVFHLGCVLHFLLQQLLPVGQVRKLILGLLHLLDEAVEVLVAPIFESLDDLRHGLAALGLLGAGLVKLVIADVLFRLLHLAGRIILLALVGGLFHRPGIGILLGTGVRHPSELVE